MAEPVKTSTPPDAPRRVDNFREWLALGIVGGASVLLVVVAVVAIIYSTDKDQTSIQILGQLLPLVGTWVGTVLAFYFTKESFQVAQKGALETFKQITPDEEARSIRASEVMIPVASFDKLTIASGQTPGDVPIADVLKGMRRGRLPVVGADGVLVCLIHESTLFEFLKDQAQSNVSYDDAVRKSLQDLLDSTRKRRGQEMKYGDFFRTTTVFVPGDATLHDTKVALSSAPQARDVFVTQNGKPSEPLQGWLTDIDIAKRLQR
jgi:hypothetical protein